MPRYGEDTIAKAVQKDLARILTDRRKELGFGQEKISELTGIDQGYISRFENGKAGLGIGYIVKYGEAVGLKIRFTVEAV